MNYNLIKVIFVLCLRKKSGYTFTNFLNKVRVEKSKKYLLKKDLSILDVAVLVGFNSQNYYSMVFKKFNNLTP
ncbi:helix-turn-helix domain-containing protein, partial [Clostridioides difficile]